jgi:hypothetical protein
MNDNILAYYGFCGSYIPSVLKDIRTKKQTPVDFHPLDILVAFLVYILGFVFVAVTLALMLVVKLIFLLFRAYANHIQSTKLWFQGCVWWTVIGYFLLYILFPVAAVLLFPAAIIYASYIATLASAAVMRNDGIPVESFWILIGGISSMNIESNRYILNQDIPYLTTQTSSPVFLHWILAGLIPAILGFPVILIASLVLVLIGVVPVMISGLGRVWDLMCFNSKGSKWYVVPFLLLLLCVVPVIVLVGIVVYFLYSVLAFPVKCIWIVHEKKNLLDGFNYILGDMYIIEYSMNKFAYAMGPADQVHWASIFPESMALLAKPYMNPIEFDPYYGMDLHPSSIVEKKPRYVPRGTRRPKLDDNGNLIDMTRAGYDIPGVGYTPLEPFKLVNPMGRVPGLLHGPGVDKVPDVLPDPSSMSAEHQEGIAMAVAGLAHRMEHGTDVEQPAEQHMGFERASYTIQPVVGSAKDIDIKATSVPETSTTCCLCLFGDPDQVDEEAATTLQTAPASTTTSSSAPVAAVVETAPPVAAAAATATVVAEEAAATPSEARETQDSSSPSALPTPAVDPHAQAQAELALAEATLRSRTSASAVLTGADKQSAAVSFPPTVARTTSGGASSVNSTTEPVNKQAEFMKNLPNNISPMKPAVEAAALTAASPEQLVAIDDEEEKEDEPKEEEEDFVIAGVEQISAPAHHNHHHHHHKPPAVSSPDIETVTTPQAIVEEENDEEEEYDEEDEDDEPFELMPIVRPDLPDAWVPVASKSGETYYVNYARNQSTWSLPQ